MIDLYATAYTDEQLEAWEELCKKEALRLGADCYPQVFRVCSFEQMMEYMAYHGMPVHFPHWSHGKEYELTSTLYKYGVTGLPYEMVINSNEAIGYLMERNTLLTQIVTMAHVFFHNDFFKNNVYFSHTHPEFVLSTMKTASEKIRRYIDDPSIGIEKVEAFLDAAKSLEHHATKQLLMRKETRTEQEQKIRARLRDKLRKEKRDMTEQDERELEVALRKNPLEPDPDLLLFIRNHNPYLSEWQRDILSIVHEEAMYFMPQIQTKILNEGWACLGHKSILDALPLTQGMRTEFMILHNNVIRPHIDRVNPYNIGFVGLSAVKLWYDGSKDPTSIRAEETKLFDAMRRDLEARGAIPPDTGKKSGWEKLFEIRRTSRDTGFLQEFLSLPLMREMHLFLHETVDDDGSRFITERVNEENWEYLKDLLIENTGENGIPDVRVMDADFNGSRRLLLKHFSDDNREIEAKEAEHVVKYAARLWMGPVILEFIADKKKTHLSANPAGKTKIETFE